MSKNLDRRAFLLVPLVLAMLAGCSDTVSTAPKLASDAVLAQGDGGVWTVTTLTDGAVGSCDDSHCTLREAISDASGGHRIVFATGLQGTIPLTSQLEIQKPLSLDGGGKITLDAQGNHGALLVVNGVGGGPMAVTFDGFTVKNGASASAGGGVWAHGGTAVTIRNSVISGNSAHTGGGGILIMPTASVTLINSTVDGNSGLSALSEGGGIRNGGTLAVIGSTISNNVAGQGGGIFSDQNASASILRSTISGNRAVDATLSLPAGGIANSGALTIQSSTIVRNDVLGFAQFDGTSVVGNTIIAGSVGSCGFDGGPLTSLGNNLSDNANSCRFTEPYDVDVTDEQVFTQVLEAELKDNGGPTKTHALLARGLAVDAGYCPGESADQRGLTRPVDDPFSFNLRDACDIGAYEAQGPQQAVADLMVSQTVDKSSVKQGEMLTYTVRVRNLGPQTAPDVVLSNVLSSGVTFVEVRVNRGTTTAPPLGETGTVTWNLGDMTDQANEVAEIQVKVLVKGKTTITNTATVSADVSDPNAANNSAAITVSVVAGSSGGGPKKTG